MNRSITNTINVILALGVLAISQGAFASEKKTDTRVVNINTATVVELAYLPGVGPTTAERIVKYRKARPFQKPFHITRVKGVGRKTYKKIQAYLTVKGSTTATSKIKLPKK